MILASAVLSQYTRVTDRRQTTERHLIGIVELAMQLQRSAKNQVVEHPFTVIIILTYILHATGSTAERVIFW